MKNTIFALATPRGKAGIGVIRVSGPRTTAVLGEVFKKRESEKIIGNPRFLRRARLLEDDRHTLLDDTMTVFFKGPHSFTGEDVAEFHIHSTPPVIESILRRLSSLEGLRLAMAGEFTRRSFLNGKMDLLMVEGLSDLLDSETNSQRLLALSLYDGRQGNVFRNWRKITLKVRSSLEAFIDFGDDNQIGEEVCKSIEEMIGFLANEVNASLSLATVGEWMKKGIKVALIGAPNAGKSSLINRLSNRRISIVDQDPGTTRDLVESSIEIGGKYSFVIYDTAGLSTDPGIGRVEREGIRRAMEIGHSADIVLFVSDDVASDNCGREAEFLRLKKEFGPKVVLLTNKTDLLPVDFERKKGCIYTSTLDDSSDGVKELKDYLVKFASSRLDSHYRCQKHREDMPDMATTTTTTTTTPIIAKLRHETILKEVSSLLNKSLDILKGGGGAVDSVVVAEYMREVSLLLGKITGDTLDHESILDEMFSSFCIGK